MGEIENNRALLLCAVEERDQLQQANLLLEELIELTKNVGLDCVDKKAIFVRKCTASLLLGTGKSQEISDFCKIHKISYIIFDNDISPSQQRNWEKLSKKKILNRQEIIIEIFAARAKTKEAVLQVELAKAKYEYPRLTRAWTHLSRQSGSLFNRGDGERQIEIDRRLIKKKIDDLEKRLVVVRKQRSIQRQKRLKRPLPSVSLVGYTNAGKSSLLNVISSAKTYADDKLFATLDPHSKKVTLPNRQECIITDTVGFIRKLPHDLIDAFRSTLEEVAMGDLLLNVIDVSDPDWQEHQKTTYDILSQINAGEKPIISVFNKIDLIDDTIAKILTKQHLQSISISTKDHTNIDLLIEKIQEILSQSLLEYNFVILPEDYELVSLLQREADIVQEEFINNSYHIKAKIPKHIFGRLKNYIIE